MYVDTHDSSAPHISILLPYCSVSQTTGRDPDVGRHGFPNGFLTKVEGSSTLFVTAFALFVGINFLTFVFLIKFDNNNVSTTSPYVGAVVCKRPLNQYHDKNRFEKSCFRVRLEETL